MSEKAETLAERLKRETGESKRERQRAEQVRHEAAIAERQAELQSVRDGAATGVFRQAVEEKWAAVVAEISERNARGYRTLGMSVQHAHRNARGDGGPRAEFSLNFGAKGEPSELKNPLTRYLVLAAIAERLKNEGVGVRYTTHVFVGGFGSSEYEWRDRDFDAAMRAHIADEAEHGFDDIDSQRIWLHASWE